VVLVGVLDGNAISKVRLDAPWRIVIELRNGKRLVIEPDIDEDAVAECKGDVECIYESAVLSVYEDCGGEGC
jgi:uncharacterized protein YlzI (FlbEa/FlbD family)